MPPEAAEAATTEQAAPSGTESKALVLERGPGGRFQKAKEIRRSSFEDRMNKMDSELAKRPAPTVEGDTTAEGDDEEEETEEGTETAAVDTATSSPGTDKPEPKPRRETVEVDEQDPKFTKERLAFNEYRRKKNEAFEAHLRKRAEEFQSEWDAKHKKLDEEWSPRIEKAKRGERISDLMDSADYEGLAKEKGYENWDKFQEHVLGVITDPNYKRTRELEKWKNDREAKEKAEAEERAKAEQEQQRRAAAQADQQKRVAAIKAHKDDLSKKMAASADRTVAAMADDRAFIDTVFEIQRQNYDPSTDSTVSPEQAIKMALRGGQRTVREELTMLYQRLKKAVGEEEAQQIVAAAAQAAPAGEAKSKTSKTGVVPASGTVEPAAAGKWTGGAKGKAWREYRQQKLNEALDAEEEAEAAKRQKKAGRGR